ncbi:SGNH/GDSL hydrolase family protein [Paramagnetospirillum kuznetsovii]|uniref:SGNH/GDSL hydrolase family protein n=1 Tax=Paramagnetospirillum kuznetsovii TaxID=2053833 RepID=A0A364NV73_9PROT|nr:SGNH/GDSL hydrolase family protein [Paramagnetospirillum kuznetsovii]RAU20984.1 SGNH/GDSL hydrolase family protein [Paramagnetospirillum kuznetsovii]
MRRKQSNPLGRLFTSVAVIVLCSVIGVAIAEWASDAALKVLRAKRPSFAVSWTPDNIRKLYDSEDVKHYEQVMSEGWRQSDTVYSPFVEFRMAPYNGKHFTITEDGYRTNGRDDQDLKAAGPKVFIYGGSTAMGIGVGNDETIAANVEKALRASGRTDVQVFNFGVVSYFSTQERIALERHLTSGVKPDVAVFVDGLNDFYYCTVPDVSAWNERLTQLTRARSRMPIALELSHRSSVVQLARHLGGDKSVMVREWGSFCDSEADVDRVIGRLDINRRMIDATAERLGFKALFVQQPVPTYSYDNRKRPFPVKEEALGYHMNSARGYPKLAQMRSQGQLWEHGLLWLAELEPADGNAYIDTVHYSPKFNKLIGERIAAAILEGGLPPAP